MKKEGRMERESVCTLCVEAPLPPPGIPYLVGSLLLSPFCISVPRYIFRELNILGEKNTAKGSPRRRGEREQSYRHLPLCQCEGGKLLGIEL